MNKKIIQKLIDELKAESFRKDYVLGILETLLDSEPETVNALTTYSSIPIMKIGSAALSKKEEGMTDADVMSAKAKAAIDEVKRLASVSTENVK